MKTCGNALIFNKVLQTILRLIHLQICKLQWHAAHVFIVCVSLSFCELVMTNQKVMFIRSASNWNRHTIWEEKSREDLITRDKYPLNQQLRPHTHTRHNQRCLYFDFHFYVNLFVTCFFFVYVCSNILTHQRIGGKDYVLYDYDPMRLKNRMFGMCVFFFSVVTKVVESTEISSIFAWKWKSRMQTKTSENS